MKIPIVNEYGSWAVFIFSAASGITTGLLTRPWQTGRDISVTTLLTVLGLTLLINSKNPLTSAARATGNRKEHFLWFALFATAGLVLLIPFLTEGLNAFYVFSPLVLVYAALLFSGNEHSLFTELNGFALLTLSSAVIYFVITGEMSFRLYLAVFVFFAAGVFKVRARIKKTSFFRWLMISYCIIAFIIFPYYLNISAIALLPLIENILSVIVMREEKLKTTGNIELVKGVIFTILLGIFRQ